MQLLNESKYDKLNIVAVFVKCLRLSCGDSTIKHRNKKRYFFMKKYESSGKLYQRLR